MAWNRSVYQSRAELNDGNQIPMVGLGTYLSAPKEVTEAVVAGWKCGYRHFDCAQVYQNEQGVGEALKILSAEPGFNRADLWITSKAWNSHHHPEILGRALDQTLKDLGTSYIDLYLIHWPANFAAIPDANSKTGIALQPTEDDGDVALDRDLSLVDTWRGMIELRERGKTKSIGVSNFSPRHIQKLVSATGVTPAVNQVEAHPLLSQEQLLQYCISKSIHITAYMPFGGDITRGSNEVLGNPVVRNIAKKTGTQAGQVLVSWAVKRGFSVLPKSTKPHRIEANLRTFALDDGDYMALAKLGETPRRFGGIPFTFDPAWKVNVFDTPEEQEADLFEPI